MTFQSLIASIRQVHEQCFAHATKAVNVSLTLRNWVIGLYILEYEQGGNRSREIWFPDFREIVRGFA